MIKKMAVIAVITCLAGISYGQMLMTGTQEIQVEGEIDFQSYAGTLVDVEVGYGYFIADYLEVGGMIELLNNDDVTAWGIGGMAEYNFDLGTELVPYVGGNLGWFTYDYDHGDSENAVVLGGEVGAKYFIIDNVALASGLYGEWSSEKVFADDDKLTDTDFGIEMGVRCYF